MTRTESGIGAFFNDPIVHWYRNIFSHVPSTKVREIAAMLKAIHAGEDIVAAREKAVQVIEKLRALRLTRAADLVEAAVEETLALPFCLRNGVSTRDMNLCGAQWLVYVLLYRRFAAALAGDRARLEVDVDRYSFIVSDLLLIAGLPAHKESGHYRHQRAFG